MSLGAYLKAGREERGLTRKELAEKVGANVNSIVKYERAGEQYGQFPPVPMLARIVAELDLPPAAVLAEALDEDDPAREHLRTRQRKATVGLYKLYLEIIDIFGALDATLDNTREQMRNIIGPPQTIPEDLRDFFSQGGMYSVYDKREFIELDEQLENENGPDHDDPSRSQSSTEEPEAVGAAPTTHQKQGGD